MKKNRMKLLVYKIILVLLIIIAIFIGSLFLFKYYRNYKNELKNQEIVELFYNDNKQEEITMNGYKVIGIVSIPKLDIKYPILDVETYNPKDAEKPMKFSIIKYWGANVNDYGNLSIAGHNNYDGTMFSKLNKMDIGDIVELTDLNNKTIEYKVYSKYNVDPNDVNILKTNDENFREVTLITCSNYNKDRLIIKAQEDNI